MDFLLGVEIDNSRIAWIYNSVRPVESKVQLTTVSDNQRRAVLNFYIKQSGKKIFLFRESLTGIPLMKAGEPSLDVKSSVRGKSFFYEIYINGSLVRRSTHDLSRYMRNRKPLYIGGAAAALLILIALIYFLLIPLLNPGQTKNITETVQTTKPDSSGTEKGVASTRTPLADSGQKNTESTIADKPAIVAETAGSDVTGKSAAEESAEKTDSVQTGETETIPAASGDKPPDLPTQVQTNTVVFTESEISDRHSVYFQPDSAVITAEAASNLEAFIKKLPKRGEISEGRFLMEIRGHCARFGTEEGRAELSKERATAVYNFIKSEWGIKADSLVTGAGASEPVTLNRDEQYLNRRVDVNIKGNYKTEKSE